MTFRHFIAVAVFKSLITMRNMDDIDDSDDRGISPYNRSVARRLQIARELAGFSTAKEFSDKNELPQSTYSVHESGKRGLKPQVSALYARILKIRLPWLLYGEEPMRHMPTKSDPNQSIMVIGAVQAGEWVEAMEWPEQEWRPVPATSRDPRFPDANQFGLAVRGPSMNRHYPDGSTIVCVRYYDIHESPKPGQRVVVQRHSNTGQMEATAKELRQDDEGKLWLWPCSDHPEHQGPIRVDNGEEVEIIARIIGAYRPE